MAESDDAILVLAGVERDLAVRRREGVALAVDLLTRGGLAGCASGDCDRLLSLAGAKPLPNCSRPSENRRGLAGYEQQLAELRQQAAPVEASLLAELKAHDAEQRHSEQQQHVGV